MLMEGWPNLRDGSALLEVKKLKDSYGKKGFARDHDFSLLECGFDECKNRLRGLFNQVLASFIEGKTVEQCMTPASPPPLCSNGRPVDLFKLFWVVRRLGGYDYISREDLWDFIAKEFGRGFGASVKLIYVKYLHELDQWLWQGRRVSNFSDDGERIVGNLEELIRDMKKEFGDLLDGWRNKGKEDVKIVLSEIGKCGNGTDSRKRLVCCSHTRNTNEMLGCLEECYHIDEKFYLDNDNDLAKQVIEKVINEVDGFSQWRSCEGGQDRNDGIVLEKRVNVKPIAHDTALNTAAVDKEELCAHVSGDILLCSRNAVDVVIDSRKRKRESPLLSEMISWVKNVAKRPDEFARRIPDCSKWKDHGNRELWLQVLLARKTLLMKKHVNSNAESSLHQKKFRMHPSMYEEDVLNHQSVEKSRCSQRFPYAKSSFFCSCCNSAPQSTVVISPKAETGYSPKKCPLPIVEVPSTNIVNYVTLDEASEKEVPVGPLFQAEVPEWTGDVFESDAKWLGSRMWLPEDVQNDNVVEYGRIGEGRRNNCDCPFPAHTECIRFHVAEKRLKLKRELGRLFYKWRFDHMGEEVSLSWTIDEERRFKDMMMFNNYCTNKFWTNAFRSFPSKTRDKLVNYYYNVFVVRRRSYQNRVTPKNVDSDDDEKELGSVGDSFGYKAIYAPELRLPACSENKQYSEY